MKTHKYFFVILVCDFLIMSNLSPYTKIIIYIYIMSDLDEKKTEEAYILHKNILSFKNDINEDLGGNYKLIENREYHENINKLIGIYKELLELSVLPNIGVSPDIYNYYINGKQLLEDIETKLKNRVEFLHDNRQETQEITPGTIDPITLEEISDGQTIAYLIDETTNKNKTFPPPPPFIYDEKQNEGISKLILLNTPNLPENPITRSIIKEVHLYTANVQNSKESDKKGSKESSKKGGRIKTNKRRGKTNKRRGKTNKKRGKTMKKE